MIPQLQSAYLMSANNNLSQIFGFSFTEAKTSLFSSSIFYGRSIKIVNSGSGTYNPALFAL